jgi:hypothetical protein
VLPPDFSTSALTGPAAVQVNANLTAKAGAGRGIEGGVIVKAVVLAVAWVGDLTTGGKPQVIRGRARPLSARTLPAPFRS